MTKTFRDLDVHETLCKALDDRGITHPFPIQELTLPLALQGNDLIGQARTGTGKTLAFGLPLLQRIDPKRAVTQALVIAPTRELANQVHDDLSIGEALGLTSHVVYGGVGYDEQIEALTGGAHVVVGTPGRLLDLLNRNILDLSQVTELVLDEADEMLDMGFLPDVERLIEACQGEDRHTMLFSATMPTAIVKLARRYMHHPTFTRADHEEKHTAPLVTQYFFQVHRMDKPRVLARILQAPERGGVYVFVRTKHMADRLVQDLEELGTPAVPIHGDLRQSSREKNLDRFRQGKATVLVATEVAARGLDVSGVTHVVNYDCPDDEKMYLHRIGRTARAGEAGVAITFAEFNEADRLNVIRKKVGATDTEVLQIFSTSDELAELFDLPEDKPWEAMVQTKVDEYHDKRGNRSRDDRGGGQRKGSSDGRSKNDRSREGQGDKQTARRDEPRPDDRAGDRRGTERSGGSGTSARPDASGRSEASGRSDTSGRSEASAGRERVRTRSRTRERDATTADRDATRRDDDRDDAATSDQKDTDTPRARKRANGSSTTADTSDAKPSSRDRTSGGDQRSGSGRQRARSADQRTDRGSQAGQGRDKDGGSSGGKDDGPSGREQRGSSGKQGDTRERRGKRGGTGDGRANGNRSGKGSGGRGDDRDPARTPVARGREARGEGQPQLARRVKVDKLP